MIYLTHFTKISDINNEYSTLAIGLNGPDSVLEFTS